MTGSICHSSISRGGSAIEHQGRIDRNRSASLVVHVEQNLARRGLSCGHRLAARLGSFYDDRAGRCESRGQFRVHDAGAISHDPTL